MRICFLEIALVGFILATCSKGSIGGTNWKGIGTGGWAGFMEGAGLSDLGQDALIMVLSKLNTVDALRASAVCRQWKAAVQFIDYMKLSQSSPARPYCMRIREDCRDLELYGLNECTRLSLDFLADKYDTLTLLACGGGLLLFRSDLGVLVVCNPISRECLELPPLDPPLDFYNPRVFPWLQHPLTAGSRFSPFFSALGQNYEQPWRCNTKADDSKFQRPIISVIVPSADRRRAEKVFLAGYKDERIGIAGSAYDFRTRFYDLERKSWEEGGRMPVRDFRSTDGVCFRNHIYSVIGMWQKSAIITYGLESRSWRSHPAGVPSSVMHPFLVEQGDKLLLVGACNLRNGLPERNHVALTEISNFSIRIWQLSECGTRWDEVARMPQEVYEVFVRNCTTWFWFECIGRGSLLYFVEKTGGIPELAYDFATDRWQVLPKMPENKSGLYIRELFLYHPSSQPL